MKDEEEDKKKVLPENEKKIKVKKISSKDQQEQEELKAKANLISPANKTVNKKELVELNSGEIIDLDEYILENYDTEKSTHFFQEEFYFPIADLLGISRDLMKNFVKPLIVPYLKKLLIYARFPNRVQERLYQKNKYTGYYTRVCYNYQWLSKEADLKLRGFITDFELQLAASIIAGYDIKRFIKDYCSKYNISYQPEIFDQL